MSNVSLEKAGNFAILSIDRAEKLNSLDRQVLEELLEIFYMLEEDEDIFVVIITGRGKAFVAGADIAKMIEMSPSSAMEFSELGQKVFNIIENSRLIVIAAINGYAFGGGNELALACDIRIASENAKFGQPEVTLGIIAGFGGIHRLTRILGEVHAKELLFTGKIINAEEALDIGLVYEVVVRDELLDKSRELALNIIKKGPLAVRKTKQAINYTINNNKQELMKQVAQLFAECFDSQDQKEGMKAFLQKRKAKFIAK